MIASGEHFVRRIVERFRRHRRISLESRSRLLQRKGGNAFRGQEWITSEDKTWLLQRARADYFRRQEKIASDTRGELIQTSAKYCLKGKRWLLQRTGERNFREEDMISLEERKGLKTLENWKRSLQKIGKGCFRGWLL